MKIIFLTRFSMKFTIFLLNFNEILPEKRRKKEHAINNIKNSSSWSKKSIVDEFFKMIPGFKYIDNGKYLNGKM